MPKRLLLRAENIGFRRHEHEVLRRQNIKLHHGEIIHIVGNNGVGKTSLLKILAGLWVPSQGRVDYRGTAILYIGHENALSEDMTVWEHMRFWHGLEARDNINLYDFAERWFAEDLRNRAVRFCSAGERRKLSLLRLCLSAADLWLLDEPFQALDKDIRKRFIDLLRAHCRGGGAIIMSGHGENDGGGLDVRRHILEGL